MSKKCPPPNKAESEYMMRVKELPCYVAVHFPDEAKNCSDNIYRDAHHELICGRRISHYDTSALCHNHHSPMTPLRFGESYHKGRRGFEAKYDDRHARVAWTQKQLGFEG